MIRKKTVETGPTSGPDRRSFLVRLAAGAGCLSLGFRIPHLSVAHATHGTEVNAWIVIQPDDTVVIRVARSEMGQGICAALPMLVAEELECDWAKVRPEFVEPGENLRRKRAWGDMSTGASRAVTGSQEHLRRAGATAREMLIAAAAARWNVLATECRVRDGIITHAPSGRRLSFGQIAEAAASVEPPKHVRLKEPSEWRLIGTRQNRADVPAKVLGQPVFAIDVRLPGMHYAAIAQCPVFGGTLQNVNEGGLRGMQGIRRVLKFPDHVVVVADSWWRAQKALKALHLEWSAGSSARRSSPEISQLLQEGLSATEGNIGREDGNVELAMRQARSQITADYSVPFLAHTTMEPQNCTAHVTPGRVEIWAPTQDGETALATAAAAAGAPPQRVIVHKMMLGGGFGRRGMVQEFIQQAVLVAREFDQPVQLIWSREEDIQHDLYRPATMARLTAALNAAGLPIALRIRVSGPSLLASIAPEMMASGSDPQSLDGLTEDMAYAVPNYRVDYAMRNTDVPIGPWRSLSHSQTAFFKESFIDEMAHAAGQDPYLYRRKLLTHQPKHLAVLDAVADKAGWNAPLPPGMGRGIAIHASCSSICAQVVEAYVDDGGQVHVHRVVSAIDPGYAVNPLSIEMQSESAIVYGLSAALYGEISIRDGRVEQSNFHDYPALRMSEMPSIETLIVASGGFWGGCGEPPLPPVAPALCNAIFGATGQRIRSLPLKNHTLGLTVAPASSK
jgi:isoquinoline 1-oxidoreductase beta subunit